MGKRNTQLLLTVGVPHSEGVQDRFRSIDLEHSLDITYLQTLFSKLNS